MWSAPETAKGLCGLLDPLIQTAHLLSAQASTALLQESPFVQEFVIRSVKQTLDYWERHNCVLDPIQREVVLDSLVATHIAIAQHINEQPVPSAGSQDSRSQVGTAVHVTEGLPKSSSAGSHPGPGQHLLVFLLSVARRVAGTRSTRST